MQRGPFNDFKQQGSPGIRRRPKQRRDPLVDRVPAMPVFSRADYGNPQSSPVGFAKVSWVALVAMTAVMSGPAVAGETTITPSITASETFSDNIDLGPGGEKKDAFLTDLTPSLRVRSTGLRVSGALDATTILRHQTAGDDKGFSVLPNVVGFGNTELIEELFFVDASASATRQILDTSDSDTESNQNTTIAYNVSPFLAKRFGSFAGAELRANFGQVFIDGGDVSDQTTYGGRFILESGEDFDRFLWSVNTTASNAKRSNDDTVKRRQAELKTEYAAFRYLSLLGGGGYQSFDDGDSDNDIDRPIWNTGLRIRPSPRAELVATYGNRDGRNSFGGNLRYDIQPNLRFTSSYAENLGTAQEQFSTDLSAIDLDPETLQIIDPNTRLRFVPRTSVTNIDDQTARTKTLRAALVGTSGRNSFQVNGTFEKRDTRDSDETDDDTDVIQAAATWGRQLTPVLSMSITASYRNTDFKDQDRKDNDYSFGGQLRYSIFENLDAFTSYDYRRNNSNDNDEDYVENRITVGLRYAF